jgi:glycosyltransferase involved in cell wall biosynthesis
MNIYAFGWPGWVGGASTKLAHLLRLLHQDFRLTVVPNTEEEMEDAFWRDWLSGLGMRCVRFEDLPRRLAGWGLALCNFEFLASPRWSDVQRRGLRLAWGNEMMWTYPGELGAILLGQVDVVLYVSDCQREALEPQYQRALSGALHSRAPVPCRGRREGRIDGGRQGRRLRWVMTGNFIDPGLFPYRERTDLRERPHGLVVGRLSRADPEKFPADFPEFYEGLGLREPRFRVRGWSPALAARWAHHRFDARWELCPVTEENPSEFLQSLDLFVYSLGPRARESWGRSVVEAMLCGAVPLVPRDGSGHLPRLVPDGRAGFVCADANEFGRRARWLERHPKVLREMSQAASAWARRRLCDAAEHREVWRRVFTGS